MTVIRLMRLPDGFNLVIFDCDGVLIDSESLAMKVYEDLFVELGIVPPADLWAWAVGHRHTETMAHIAETTEPAAMARLRAEVWPRIRARFASDLQPTPGVAEFLAALEAPCCVASASDPERIRFSLEATRLAKYFDGHMFSSHAVEHSKPAPDIFLYAAAQMGVAPTASVVIEDSTAGVIAGLAAGAKVIGYLGGSHLEPGHGQRLLDLGAHAVASDWREVAERLAALA